MTINRSTLSRALCLALAIGSLVLGIPGTATAAPLNDCASSDNGDPVLTSFSLSPSSVDVTNGARQVHFSLAVTDPGGPGPATGAKVVKVGFGPNVVGEGGPHMIVLTKNSAGLWVGSTVIPRWSKSGILVVRDVSLMDRAGNQRQIGGAELTSLGFPHSVTVTSIADTTKPILTAFTLTPRSVNTRTSTRLVTFTARATDAQSHVGKIEVAGNLNGSSSISAQQDVDIVWLTKVPGTAHTFRGHMRVRRWVGNGTWKAFGVLVADRIGNVRIYWPPKLDTLGFPHTLTVTSRTDTEPAHLASFTLKPTPIDIRTSSATVSLRVHATDALSGVGRVVADLGPMPNDVPLATIRLHRVAGTARDGIWVGTATIARCAPITGHLWASVFAIDRRGHGSGSTSSVAVQAVDHIAPGGWLESDTGTINQGDPLKLDFSENVNGINTTSAPVHQELPDGSQGPAVPGAWTCLTANATVTDCETGSLRTASFAPTNGFAAGHWYHIDLNPEFTLDITDLAGNPMRRGHESFFVKN
jgi:hypothetical protein